MLQRWCSPIRTRLLMGLYRAVCENGLVVSRGAFPTICVAHRGNVVDEVVSGALQMSERFDLLVAQVERMEARQMLKDEQLAFAEGAQLLTIRRPQHLAVDLYTVLNRTQENLLRGGLTRRAPSGRLTRTRRVTSI